MFSAVPPPGPDIDATADSVVGGRVRLVQPRRGHRAGHDAVLLAAAVPAAPGDRVLELGAGVGTAALALAARVASLSLTLVEIDPQLAALAERNLALNGMMGGRVVVADALARGRAREAAGLAPGAFDRVLTNPPFHDPARHRPSPERALAYSGGEEVLEGFVRTAAAVLRPGGTLTLIHRADRPAQLLGALAGRFGGLVLLPVHPKPAAPAVRLIVTGTKGSRAPVSILPGIVLQDAEGRPTPEAERVLRSAKALSPAP